MRLFDRFRHEIGVFAKSIACPLDLDNDRMVKKAVKQSRRNHGVPKMLNSTSAIAALVSVFTASRRVLRFPSAVASFALRLCAACIASTFAFRVRISSATLCGLSRHCPHSVEARRSGRDWKNTTLPSTRNQTGQPPGPRADHSLKDARQAVAPFARRLLRPS